MGTQTQQMGPIKVLNTFLNCAKLIKNGEMEDDGKGVK
jgi:hypothetical protein